jgi:RNA polymerase sigma-70 factor, ECF subfamily
MTSSAYVSPEVHDAREALTTGLTALRTSLNELLHNPLLSVVSPGGRTRTKTNDGHHEARQPATKPVGGRVNGRPVAPAQGGHPTALDGDTTRVIPLVPVDGETTRLPTGDEQPPAYPSRPDPSDAAAEVWALVERAQAGEAEAFGLIYDRYVDTVFRFIYFRVGNRPLAEDLTSDTFLRALKRIGSFTWQGRDLGAWLVTIARNLVADHFKSGRYRLEVTTGDVLDADREDRGPEGSPEAAVVDHITNVALLTAVKQLNPEQQECIVLRFLQGFSVAETAQAMGKNEGAIKALQYRAVRALARLLPEGFQP